MEWTLQEKKKFLHTQSGANNKERETIHLSVLRNAQLGVFRSNWKMTFFILFTVCSFANSLQNFSRVGNLDLLHRAIHSIGVRSFNLLHNIVSLDNLTKDNMTVIQPISLDSGNEEL